MRPYGYVPHVGCGCCFVLLTKVVGSLGNTETAKKCKRKFKRSERQEAKKEILRQLNN